MTAVCWLCGWIDAGCEETQLLVGAYFYTRRVCSRCRQHAWAVRAAAAAIAAEPLEDAEIPPAGVQPEPRSPG